MPCRSAGLVVTARNWKRKFCGFDGGEYACDSSYASVAESIANYLGAVGIRTKMRPMERAAFLTEHRAGVNLAFSLDKNEFQGETYLELTVADFKSLSDL